MTGILVAIAFLALFTLLAYNRFVLMRHASDKILSGMEPLFEERDALIGQWIQQVPESMKDREPLWGRLHELVNRSSDDPLTANQKVAHDNLIREMVDMIKGKEEQASEAAPGSQQLQALNEKEKQLDAHRQSYNKNTTDYNNAIQLFPSNVFALIFTFKTRKLFKGL